MAVIYKDLMLTVYHATVAFHFSDYVSLVPVEMTTLCGSSLWLRSVAPLCGSAPWLSSLARLPDSGLCPALLCLAQLSRCLPADRVLPAVHDRLQGRRVLAGAVQGEPAVGNHGNAVPTAV